MDVPTNHEHQRRIPGGTNNQDTFRRIFRGTNSNEDGVLQRTTGAINRLISVLIAAGKGIAIMLIIMLLICLGFKYFLLILIAMHGTP